jgi:putative nucleotidyltransferase with HDIG domain/PAS domain S-box-containing protein
MIKKANNWKPSISYNQLFNNIVDGVLIISYPDGIIRDVNDSLVKISGYEKNYLIGKNLWEINFFEDHKWALDCYAEFLKKRPIKAEKISILKRNGEKYLVNVSGNVYKIDHKLIIQINLHDERYIYELRKIIKDYQVSSKKSYEKLIQAMLTMVKFNDPYTARHQVGVSKLAIAIAQEMGLSQSEIDGIRLSALVHDIGKISIPSEILTKSGLLNSYEIALIQNHVKVGFEILKDFEFPWKIANIVLQHHERNDGLGYPNQLAEIDICLEAKIIAVADTIEAMTHFRPYRPALGIETALHQIKLDKGIKLDTATVEACLKVFQLKKFSFDPV